MNRRLNEAIERIRTLPDERQQQAAALLIDFLERDEAEIDLTEEQWAEVEKALSDDEPYASEEETRAFFARLLK